MPFSLLSVTTSFRRRKGSPDFVLLYFSGRGELRRSLKDVGTGGSSRTSARFFWIVRVRDASGLRASRVASETSWLDNSAKICRGFICGFSMARAMASSVWSSDSSFAKFEPCLCVGTLMMLPFRTVALTSQILYSRHFQYVRTSGVSRLPWFQT